MASPLAKEMKPVFRSVVNDVVRSFRFDINAKNSKGLTALHHAAKRSRRWNLKVLLLHNPDTEVPDTYVCSLLSFYSHSHFGIRFS